MKTKTKSGSGLIFAVVLLFVILGMVVTLSSVTLLETKMNQKTKSSVGAFYNSESGVEWALNKIATGTGTNISDIFGASFSQGKVTCPSGFGCELYLLDGQGKVIASDAAIDQVKAVRSVGNQGGDTQRAIEAAVAADGGGGIYTAWGGDTCPGGDTEIYDGEIVFQTTDGEMLCLNGTLYDYVSTPAYDPKGRWYNGHDSIDAANVLHCAVCER